MKCNEKLTTERLRQVVSYDPETGIFIWLDRPYMRKRKGEIAGNRPGGRGYLRMMIDGTNYRAHRLAWLYVHGEWPKDQIDHINGIRDDNRIANLRDVDGVTNTHNQRRPPVSNTSGYLGVSWDKTTRRWFARIGLKRRTIYLGHAETPEAAYALYVEGKRRLHPGSTL